MLFGFDNSGDRVNFFNLGCETTTNVTAIAEMVVEEMGLQNAEFRYTGGDRGWPGDVPQCRFDITKMEKLGWQPKLTSNQAVRGAVRLLVNEIVGSETLCRS
jgi:UDP-glucose 4-epimerase